MARHYSGDKVHRLRRDNFSDPLLARQLGSRTYFWNHQLQRKRYFSMARYYSGDKVHPLWRDNFSVRYQSTTRSYDLFLLARHSGIKTCFWNTTLRREIYFLKVSHYQGETLSRRDNSTNMARHFFCQVTESRNRTHGD